MKTSPARFQTVELPQAHLLQQKDQRWQLQQPKTPSVQSPQVVVELLLEVRPQAHPHLEEF